MEIRTGARVFEITTGPDGRATGARYYDRDGVVRQQSARAVIIAANGIGTPRLMLLSKSDRHPHGLANSTGLVGKNLMFHPYGMITGFFRDPEPHTHRGPLGNVLMSQEFYETDQQRGFVRGYTYQMNRSSGPAKTATGLGIRPVPWGQGHHEEFAERFGRSSHLCVISEDLPEEYNRVELDPRLTDSSGIPGAQDLVSALRQHAKADRPRDSERGEGSEGGRRPPHDHQPGDAGRRVAPDGYRSNGR